MLSVNIYIVFEIMSILSPNFFGVILIKSSGGLSLASQQGRSFLRAAFYIAKDPTGIGRIFYLILPIFGGFLEGGALLL